MSCLRVGDRAKALLEVELGPRAAWMLLAESGQVPMPDGRTPLAWITRLVCQANGIQPHKPCARTVRRTLKTTGLASVIYKVTTGGRVCRVHLRGDSLDRGDDVVAALRPLWNDGHARVRKLIDSLIYIDVPGWWNTYPQQDPR